MNPATGAAVITPSSVSPACSFSRAIIKKNGIVSPFITAPNMPANVSLL